MVSYYLHICLEEHEEAIAKDGEASQEQHEKDGCTWLNPITFHATLDPSVLEETEGYQKDDFHFPLTLWIRQSIKLKQEEAFGHDDQH